MVMPIDSYGVLQALDNLGRMTEIRDALKQFSLFAFVLHDPRHHPELDQTLAEELANLDTLTGTKLLFFALVEASTAMKNKVSSRHYFSALSEATQRPGYHAKARTARNPTLTAYGASHLLGLPAGHMPCIVIFLPDAADKFLYLPTSASTVVDQLSRLGRAASSMPAIQEVATRRDVETLRQICNGENLPALLGSVPERYRNRARSGVGGVRRVLDRKALRQPLQELGRAASELPAGVEGVADRDELLLEWSSLLSLYRGSSVPWPWAAAPRELWELESDAVLGSAASLAQLPDLLEFSPLVICYGKALEVELNASFCQELRQRNGIEMPDFFLTHQPGRKVRLEVKALRDPVDLNKRSKDERGHLAPSGGLGTIQQTAAAYGPGTGFSEDEWTGLLDTVGVIKKVRNDAAHSRIVPYAKANTCSRAFGGLVTRRLMHRLFETKLRLQGSDPDLPWKLAAEAEGRRGPRRPS